MDAATPTVVSEPSLPGSGKEGAGSRTPESRREKEMGSLQGAPRDRGELQEGYKARHLGRRERPVGGVLRPPTQIRVRPSGV